MKRRLVWWILLGVLVAILYAGAVRGDFILDDLSLVKENSLIASWANAGSVLTKGLWQNAYVNHRPYRPVSELSFMGDYSLWGLNSVGYHLTNIFLHIAVVVGLGFFLAALGAPPGVVFGACLMFAVLPVHAEAVAYISGRNEMLSALFMLLAFRAYLFYQRQRRGFWVVLVFFLFLCALLSKENAFIFPLLLLAYHAVWGQKFDRRLGLGVAVAAAGMVVLRLTVFHSVLLKTGVLASVAGRLPVSLAALASYVRLFLFPVNLHFCYSAEAFSWTHPLTIVGGVLLGIFISMFFWLRRRSPLASFGILWFLIALLPVLNLYPLNFFVMDHWLYWPSVGLCLSLACGMDRVRQTRNKGLMIALIFALCGYLVFFAVQTAQQSVYWGDPGYFYKRTIALAGPKALFYNDLGLFYEGKGQNAEALEAYRKALESDPHYFKAYMNLGYYFQQRRNYALAMEYYLRGIDVQPTFSPFYANLAALYGQMGRLDEALTAARKAVTLNPHNAAAYYNLGNILMDRKEYQEAASAFLEATGIVASYGKAYGNLAICYYCLNDIDKAKAAMEAAERYGVINSDLRNALASLSAR